MTLFHAPSVQSPKAYDLQNLQASQLGTRLAAGANAALRGNLRTALQDAAYRYQIHASETAAGLVDANLTFGFDVGDVRRYGADPTGAADSTTAFQRAVSAATQATGLLLVTIPGGTYKLSATLVWGFTGLTVRSTGKAFLTWPANSASDLIQIDGGAAPGITGVRIEGWIKATGNLQTLNAWFVRAAHKSFFGGCRAGDCLVGLRVNWCVCSEWENFTCSVNEAAFTHQTPAIGIILDVNAANATTSFCTFINPVLEGITSGGGQGINLSGTLGNQILGGTSEANLFGLVQTGANNSKNVVRGMDFESNTNNDVVLAGGQQIAFYDCGFSSNATINPNIDMQVAIPGLAFYGGYIRWINMQADHATFVGCEFSNGGTVGLKSNGHVYKAVGCITVDGSGNFSADLPDQLGESGTFSPTIAGATTAGTQTYTQNKGYYQRVGHRVDFTIYINLATNAGGGTGTARISGLPFTARNQSFCNHSFAVCDYSGVTLGAAGRQLSARLLPAGNTLDLLETDTGSVSNFIAITAIGGTALIVISGSYLID
jgi:hypothetical protein